ncbi:MAG: hypothetical protein QOC71_150 [Thermoplasmata archaeon]|nr:hypothetical protein [Thermoplasmata archaeon]
MPLAVDLPSFALLMPSQATVWVVALLAPLARLRW